MGDARTHNLRAVRLRTLPVESLGCRGKPDNDMLRIYRVRVYGYLTKKQIHKAYDGITIDGMHYRSIKIEREEANNKTNNWYKVTLSEGKNREIKGQVTEMTGKNRLNGPETSDGNGRFSAPVHV